MARIQVRRGLAANLPNSGMLAGEPLLATDQGTLHVALDATTRLPVVPDLSALSALPSVSGAEDLLLIWDGSETAAPRAKRITFEAFKTALNIPSGANDEQVAVVAGGTAGYIWGTDGTDGVLRMGASMSWTKDAGNGHVVLDVEVVDGGTF
jgi:hypothetical protein